MKQSVRITSKRQITIPASIYRELNLEQGQRLVVQEENHAIILTPATKLIEDLAGSVKIPKEYKEMKIDEIIRQAKEDRFRRRYGKNLR